MTNIGKIGVVGAGQMGHGIAQVCATAGHPVLLVDVSNAAVEKGLTQIRGNLERLVSKGKMDAARAQTISDLVQGSTQYDGFADVDLVIESASEKEALKKDIFQQVLKVVPKHTILATNTSSISITRLAASTDRPEKFIGMHFMNPVPVMELVEIIRGIATDEATFQLIKELSLAMGKNPVSAEDFPAFIVNRILLPMINEAVYTLYEGVGSVEAIDISMRLGTRHPMGPLELADFIGLDTCLAIMQVLYDGLADTKYRPCPLLVKYVEAGWLGRKTGRGFYDYRGEKPIPTR